MYIYLSNPYKIFDYIIAKFKFCDSIFFVISSIPSTIYFPSAYKTWQHLSLILVHLTTVSPTNYLLHAFIRKHVPYLSLNTSITHHMRSNLCTHCSSQITHSSPTIDSLT